MTSPKIHIDLPTQWDLEADVVVVGYGLAGAIAAIDACDAGASVILLEKMPQEGGISRTGGGASRAAQNAQDAFRYLRATCGGRTPDDLLQVMAEGLVTIPSYVEKLAKINGARVNTLWTIGTYPLPGTETFGTCTVEDVPGWDPIKDNPHSRGFPAGARLWKVISDNVNARKIDVRLNTPAKQLIADVTRQVLGVLADSPQGEVRVKARKAVILTCGGFEANEDMLQQYAEAKPMLNSVFLGNTGDGIHMAQELGADLWHMWHIHGSYGWRHTDAKFKTAIRTFRFPNWYPGRPWRPNRPKMPWILVDKLGMRYMNEYPIYMQDTSHRPMAYYDTAMQDFPRIPSYMILDDAGLKRGPLALMTFNDTESFYEWSDDNLKEVENGIIGRVDTIEELARKIKVDSKVLTATIKHWNDLCEQGEDPDFGRPGGSMLPINEPPYYYSTIWPIISNTHGGPRHDKHQAVIDVRGKPIPRLYAAGELGGVFGHLYISGGNFAECFTGARTAAREAVALPSWEA